MCILRLRVAFRNWEELADLKLLRSSQQWGLKMNVMGVDHSFTSLQQPKYGSLTQARQSRPFVNAQIGWK